MLGGAKHVGGGGGGGVHEWSWGGGVRTPRTPPPQKIRQWKQGPNITALQTATSSN